MDWIQARLQQSARTFKPPRGLFQEIWRYSSRSFQQIFIRSCCLTLVSKIYNMRKHNISDGCEHFWLYSYYYYHIFNIHHSCVVFVQLKERRDTMNDMSQGILGVTRLNISSRPCPVSDHYNTFRKYDLKHCVNSWPEDGTICHHLQCNAWVFCCDQTKLESRKGQPRKPLHKNLRETRPKTGQLYRSD